MKVRNSNLPLGEVIDFEGKVHEGDAFGVYDVPSDFGNWLCGTPNWEPKDGASLGEISTKVEEKLSDVDEPSDEEREAAEAAAKAEVEAEAAAAQEAERARLEAEAKAAAKALAATDVARADTQERQVIDGKEGTPVVPPAAQGAPTPPAPPAPETAPPAPTPEAASPGDEGPDLEAMTKAELLATAELYREKGYTIEFEPGALKPDIKAALHKALYGDENSAE